jgi:hypothetical protein|tara:strand:+ start:2951 stop:5947 length:2997 start_codon:yes stop_codon:yes gene_type:complete
MIKEELYINGESVELINSLNPNLTFNIADIAKPDTRKADHSKTIELPASKKINKIFEHIFDLDTDLQTFNPNLKTDVIYLVNGEIQIDGYLQLKSVKDNDGHIIYNCIIIGRVGNFIADLGAAELTDLDLSSLNHTWNKASQSATWNYPLTTDYVYPMINYNTNYGTLGTGTENWPVTTLYPAVKAKKYLDLIFDSIGYTYTSTFLTSSFFNTLIIPFNATEFKLTETEILSRLFEVNTPQITSTTNTFVTPVYHDYENIATDFDTNFINFTNEVNDPSNLYNNTTGVYEITAGKSGYYNLSAMLQLQGVFNAPTDSPSFAGGWKLKSSIVGYIKLNKYNSSGVFETTLDSINYGVTDFDAIAAVGGTITTAANPTTPSRDYFYHRDFQGYIYNLGNQNTNDVCNKFFVNANNIFLNENETVKVELTYSLGHNFNTVLKPTQEDWRAANLLSTSQSSTGVSYQLNILSGFLKNESVNSSVLENNTIPMNSVIPRDVKQKDYIMSLVKMFNLYIQPDSNDNKNLIIEPREDFYSNDIIDWSTKIDKSKDVESLPMGALNSKEYLYTYKQDKDYYNELYFDTWDEVYGQDDFTLVNEFLQKTHKTEIIFSPTPSVGQDWYDRVIPTIIKYDESSGVQRIESNIRILQWGGMKATGQQWIHVDNASNETFYSTYPYAGMYDDPYSPTTLLEFGLTNEIYYSNVFDKVVTFSDNTLFNKYYAKFLQEITDVNSRIVNAHFYLTPSDIKNLSFSKQYYFEGQYFRLNKVENYNPINPITKCEFLKLKLSNVFSPSTAVSRGGTGLLVGTNRAPLFSNSNSALRNSNSIGNLNQRTVGSNNYISRSARGVNVIGDSNRILSNASNVEITGSNNIINPGCENVRLINTDGQTITGSNITYINNEITAGTGSTKTITSFTKANLNVQQYFCDASGGSFTVDFSPTVNITIGKIWTFKKVNSANQVTIDASTIGATIDGSNTYVLNSHYKYVTIQYDGQNFLITSNN